MSSTWTERLDNPVSARLRNPATSGIVGIVLGCFAAFLAIPPIMARGTTWPILVGVVAALLGIWTVTRGMRRLGWGAFAAGVLGIALGVLATRSGTGNLNAVFDATLIAQTFGLATPLVFGSIAGMMSERSGVINVGLEGMMLMGAFWGIYGADKGGWPVGLLLGGAVGGILALVYGFFAIQLRSDQIVGGTAVNFLALGITGYFFVQLYNNNPIPNGVATLPNFRIPWLADVHFLGPAIGDLNVMIWAGFVLVVVSYILLFKTPIGLRIRACGEHPRAADTVGINVYAIRYGCVMLSGVLAALGGVYLSDGYGNGTFIADITNGRGFIALAAMIFGNWRPGGAFGASLLFGFSSALALRLQVYSASAATLFNVLPYVLTLIAVAGVIGRTVPPAADGKPYRKQ
ncbi:MAG TPA: ABC transporter permease [Gaiellaceae bacterium]|nr:ABC transporter permease [Gaiellaceae bacterium]